MEATAWTPPRNARGRTATMRSNLTGEVVDYDSLEERDFQSGQYYNSCQCPCGCEREARYFAADTSNRPYLCGVCIPPNDEHERELTAEERSIVELPSR